MLFLDILSFIYNFFSAIFYYTPFNWNVFVKLPIWGKILSLLTTLFTSVFLLLIAVLINFLNLFGQLPDISVPESHVPIASEMYSGDGVLIARYFTENRSPVKFAEISPAVIHCLIATEDVRFYEHRGIDIVAIFSAIWSNVQGEKRGGSTITQQLVKNIFKTRQMDDGVLDNTPGFRTFNFKLKEWITAVKLEYKYSKNEILTMYLNTVDFGSNAFGIRTAARAYFDTNPRYLNMQEAATLIGLLKATSYYSPVRNPKRSKERRNVVLGQLKKYNYITANQFDSLINLPIELKFPKKKPVGNIAPYFRNAAARFLEKWCKEKGYNLYTDGLKIYTTIDTRIQYQAEQAIAKQMPILQERFYQHWASYYQSPWNAFRKPEDIKDQFVLDLLKKLKSYEKDFKYLSNYALTKKMNERKQMKIFTWQGVKDTLMSPIDSVKHGLQILQAALMSIDPYTGFIKAWVGGINYDFFNLDHINQSKRQPGSTFKPFVYAEAFERGFGPCDVLPDVPLTINYMERGEKKSWSPKNSDYEYTYTNITLRKAMGASKNTVTALLTQKITPTSVKKRARLMGINSVLDTVPSIGLGSNVVSLYEMTGAYATFMNRGEWIEPQFITQIEDRNGNVIYISKPKRRRAMSEENAFLMTYMFKGGIEEQDGTSQALFEFPELFEENELGGKTGTSSDYADGWYIGLTKDLVTGIWVGADDHRIRFRTPEAGEASQTALPIFGVYMQTLYKDEKLGIKKSRFPEAKVKINKFYNCLMPYIAKKKKEKKGEKGEEE